MYSRSDGGILVAVAMLLQGGCGWFPWCCYEDASSVMVLEYLYVVAREL